jgi:aspartyl-tRNA(Asn)/glutamyl-tRNA(Gln) amidotransferase subunit A
MSPEELAFATIGELAPKIQKGELSPVELTQAVLERVELYDDQLLAYITVVADRALGLARSAEVSIASGQYLGPLHGIPLALKDLVDTPDITTTGGSALLKSRVPSTSATVARRLMQAGTILLGKTNMTEFALGPEGTNPHFGTPRNPWKLDGLPGGSSSGSGVAVAAGLATIALGSDTGGSVRIPAALCGIVGLKPTFGLVSNYGIMPLSSSLDSVGPMIRSVQDAALVLAVIAGPDAHDPNTLSAPVASIPTELTGHLKGRRLAIPREMLPAHLHPEIRKCFAASIGIFTGAGAAVEEIGMPALLEGRELMMAITRPEAYSFNRDIIEGHLDEIGLHQRTSLLQGMKTPAHVYLAAQRRRRELSVRIWGQMEPYDALIFPTTVLPTMDEASHRASGFLYSELTRAANAFGLCSISVPGGFTDNGLPVGLQIVGKPYGEATILEIAYGYEQRTEWHHRRPGFESELVMGS